MTGVQTCALPISAWGGPDLGYAVFDLIQAVPVNGKTESTKARITALVTYDAKSNHWRVFHWHATLLP